MPLRPMGLLAHLRHPHANSCHKHRRRLQVRGCRMIAVCRHTRSGLLADHQRGRFVALDEAFALTVDRKYVVVGMGIWETVLQVLTKDDNGLPAWCPAALFDIDDQAMPPSWRFALRSGAHCSGTDLWTRWVAHWGYEQLVSDERHSDALMERDAEALVIFESEYAHRVAELE
jgi:hypothetical protein